MLEERTIRLGKKDPGFFTLLVRMTLGVIFTYASVDKILNPGDFAETLYGYQLLPGSLIKLKAIILPWLELVLGVLLVVGLWVPGAASLSALLLLTFFGTILFNIARGLDIHCGCFSAGGAEVSGAPMFRYVVRDGVFLLLSLYLFRQVFFAKGQSVLASDT